MNFTAVRASMVSVLGMTKTSGTTAILAAASLVAPASGDDPLMRGGRRDPWRVAVGVRVVTGAVIGERLRVRGDVTSRRMETRASQLPRWVSHCWAKTKPAQSCSWAHLTIGAWQQRLCFTKGDMSCQWAKPNFLERL